jgi:hypothetical protein
MPNEYHFGRRLNWLRTSIVLRVVLLPSICPLNVELPDSPSE